ncbi:unnamed protein product [Owenia fusiformis]|uniref:SYO1-like TPR repeats domain-containing protein n=1 Tax=Owenia fusiformis TaxID=6347 RepID=A0A8S4NF53_OWEFU|nr:unnamed protein product [Owenia fusiformis]
MGKSKVKKRQKNRDRPTGLESVNELEAEESEIGEAESACGGGAIAGFIEKLQSASVEERECGCATIANLVCQKGAAGKLMKQNIVKILGPLMIDENLGVRQGAVGTLRNLSTMEAEDVCPKMVADDVMTPLITLFKQYEANWSPGKTSDKKVDVRTDIFHQAMHLLWNICENSEIAVNILNQSDLIETLVPCLQSSVYGLPLAVTTAQCLHTISENNTHAVQQMLKLKADDTLQSIMGSPHEDGEQLLLRTLSAGTLYNMRCVEKSTNISSVEEIMGVVSEVLTQDVVSQIVAAVQLTPDTQKEEVSRSPDSGISSPEENQYVKYENMVQDVEHSILAQQLALEIAANLCCSEDEEEAWEDLDSSDASSEELFNEEVEDMDQADIVSPLSVPSEIHSAILSHRLIDVVMEKTAMLEPDIHEHLTKTDSGQNVLKKFADSQSKALLCINNLVTGVDLTGLGGLDRLESIWTHLSQLALNKHVLKNLALLEATTSAMRATIQILANNKSNKFNEVSASDLQFLFDMGQQCNMAAVRANVIRIISTIGCLLVTRDPLSPLLRNIGVFLIVTSMKDAELWVIAESLDATFDVFGEDNTKSIELEISLLEKLKSLAPILKTKINQQKHKLGEHLPIIQTARTNLIRFIKYKQTH